MPEVTLVGSVNVDLIVRVARLPGPGTTVTGGTFERQPGGKGANQAVAAARSGARVRFVGAIGDDDIGRSARAAFRAEGIEDDGLATLASVPTGVALIVVDARGENQIAVASGANAKLDAAFVRAALGRLRPAPGGVCLLGFEVPDEALVAAGEWAAECGLLVVINPAPARPVPAALLALRPILTPNAGEAAQLAGTEDPTTAATWLSETTSAPVIITLGRDGALLVSGGEPIELAPYPVHSIDTTGAGDAFNGILAARLAAGEPLLASLEWAMAGAALSTLAVGAQAGMPTLEEIAAHVVSPGRSR
jgi:ribokinase